MPDGASFADVAQNAQEVKALTRLREHIDRSWLQHANASATDDEVREILSMVYIHVLDADVGGQLEADSKNILRSRVLADGNQAETAWNALTAECSLLATQRMTTSLIGLQHVLLREGVLPDIARSFREDVERLRQVSREAVGELSNLASIHMGATVIKLERKIVGALRVAAEGGSLLVTGDPGAGKSGVLSDFSSDLLSGNRDVVVILADHWDASSLGLLRAELGLEHDLVEVLRNWPGSQPAFLVVDALDAARAEPAARTLRQLIAAVQALRGRWRVVASIRRYDLGSSYPLRELFQGTPVDGFGDVDFCHVAHAHVPLLSDDEIREVERRSAELAVAIRSAGAGLQKILRVPFNLRLLAEIVAVSGPTVDIQDVHTDIQLLDRYWSARVLRGDHRGDAREHILRRACEAMVARRRLTVERKVVVEEDLADLLSANVLSEWRPPGSTGPESQTLRFTHHVLFDYAAARLLLRGHPRDMADRLEAQPDLVLMIQPSLRYHLRYVWNHTLDRRRYWDLCLDLANRDRVSETAKLLGPAVAAALIRTVSDCEPLFTALESSDKSMHGAAERCLGHLTRALLATENPRAVLLEDGSPWPQIVERISASMSRQSAYHLRPLLCAMSEDPSQ